MTVLFAILWAALAFGGGWFFADGLIERNWKLVAAALAAFAVSVACGIGAQQ